MKRKVKIESELFDSQFFVMRQEWDPDWFVVIQVALVADVVVYLDWGLNYVLKVEQ